MIITPKTGYQPPQKQRKAFFPFQYGLRSQKFVGIGANKADNVWYRDGRLKKMAGSELFKTIDAASIVYLGEFQKTDGTYQILACYPVSTYYVMRAIEEDGTVVTPSGGAGDVNFTSSEFSSEQVLALGFIGNNSATTPLYSWDGTTLTAIASAPTLIRGLARDGKRLAAITSTTATFSQAPITTTFAGGADVNVSGDYSMSIQSARAILTAGMGVIIVGETGSEAHKVVPNNSSDDVSADTKIDGYNDNEHGVVLQKQAVMGKSFMWRVTPEGIMRTNPFNGETVNITDVGRARDYWAKWTHDNDAIAYDETNEQVVCCVADGAQNDILVCVDTTAEDMPMSVKIDSHYSILGSINNQLYGGGSREGNIDKLFTTQTNPGLGELKFKYVSEWDELTNQMYGKTIKRVFVASNLSPDSSMDVKIYLDGSTTPVFTNTFTTNDTSEVSIVDAPYGVFVFGGSLLGITNNNSDQVSEARKTRKFSTIAIEVSESSADPFEVYDIIIEYETKNKFYHQLTRADTLFS